jgi:chromosome segregation ATPase
MDDTFLIYALQGVLTLLLGAIAFNIKSVFSKLEQNDKRINKLEVDMARNTSENETLFRRLESIEAKLDRLIEGWTRSRNS